MLATVQCSINLDKQTRKLKPGITFIVVLVHGLRWQPIRRLAIYGRRIVLHIDWLIPVGVLMLVISRDFKQNFVRRVSHTRRTWRKFFFHLRLR